MNRSVFLLLVIAVLGLAPLATAQQQQTLASWLPEDRATQEWAPATVLEVTDSIRHKVGYRHWQGAAIGGGVGAVAGLVLALAAGHSCSHCDPDLVATSLASAGVVGAFGFLVGLASPKYQWIPDTLGVEP